MLTAIHKFYDSERYFSEFQKNPMIVDSIIPTIGLKESSFSILKNIEAYLGMLGFYNRSELNFIMIDVANGYTEKFVNFIKKAREEHPHVTIIAGNVATPEATEALIFAGADIVKIGIGPSEVCDTRIKTGVGVPQLTAVMECADAAHGLGAHVIADGGCKEPGDIAKAFGAGADFVILGSMLAGHDESGGEIITKWKRGNEVFKDIDGTHLGYLDKEEKYKEVYGMSSSFAMNKYYGKKNDYRASEGNYSLTPYKGKVKNTIEDIFGGLRSACTYVGAQKLKHFSKCTTFIRVNRIK